MKQRCLGRTHVLLCYVILWGITSCYGKWICHHMSQMKPCDCKTCKLKVDLLMKGIRFARAIEWYSRVLIKGRDAGLAHSIFRETWIWKLFFLIRDLKVLRDPWRTWIINRYSWFYHSTLRDFETQVLQIVTVVYRECLSHALIWPGIRDFASYKHRF